MNGMTGYLALASKEEQPQQQAGGKHRAETQDALLAFAHGVVTR